MTEGTRLSRALIFHGHAATPENPWFSWVADELEHHGTCAIIPPLPDPYAPETTAWEGTIESTLGEPDERTVVIAHSLGCLAVLRYLSSLRTDWNLGGLVLVSGFTRKLPALPELDGFITSGLDVSTVRQRVQKIPVLRSDNDGLVPSAFSDELATLLGVKAHVQSGAGHFLAEDGVTELPRLLDWIQ
ncbi:RBBP9/YdeN family alpha/beta hydrolase [Sediminivirga luteola]|jgi:predicted alpha/beta hydrolase family esterase|uniref:RBBP9/YdeN family alpha/beta hydrolase n=1 Tax=Sediminivirga luteola TaxID=1774748 RepID=UPI0016676AC8|nr:alpha/beta hydrolase [Sediminivirga luteola]